MRAISFAAIVAVGISGQTLQAEASYDATITRTEFNIPHITSDTWGGVGYGVAYAYAQDNICMLAEEFATIEGSRSLHFGPEARSRLGFSEVDNLTSDIFYRGRIDLPALRAGWSQQSAEAKELVDGYVAGYNRYLRETDARSLPEACRDKPWVRPITRDDMLRLNEKQMLLASSLALAPGIATAAPPSDQTETEISFRFPQHEDEVLGSNGWAFGKDATKDGKGLLIGNPHFPWAGPARFWQLHVTKPGEYDAMGVGIAGTPIPTLGFNKDVAWTHTVTAARHFTIYALTLADDDPTSYIVDGEKVAMERREITVPMPEGTPPVTRTLYSTQFGPVVKVPNSPLGWSDAAAYALRDANAGNQRAIDTWLKIGKAKNVGEIESAISETLGIPWVNTIAADREGSALHADITAVPNVSAEMAKSCSTPISGLVAGLITLLDGARGECNWRAPGEGSTVGLLPANDQASRTRTDYVTNSNDSYWISNPRTPYRQLSPILGDFEKALSLRTRSNFIETEAALASSKFDHNAAKQLVFGNKSLAADMVVDPVLELCETSAGHEDACNALRGWDRKFEKGSRGAYLFAEFWEKVRQRYDLWQVPFDASAPIQTPRDLKTDDSAGEALLEALSETVAELEDKGIALDAAWGKILSRRLRDGRIDLHGGPGTAGVLNMQRGRKVKDGLAPLHGSSYIQIVSFDEDGPVAEAILSYSQSTDPASVHYSDQTYLYSNKQWHELPFSAEEIEAKRRGEQLRISE